MYVLCREYVLARDLANVVPKLGELPGLLCYDAYVAKVCAPNHHRHALNADGVAQCVGQTYRKWINKLHALFHDTDGKQAASRTNEGGKGAVAGPAGNLGVNTPPESLLQPTKGKSSPVYPQDATVVPQMPLDEGVAGHA